MRELPNTNTPLQLWRTDGTKPAAPASAANAELIQSCNTAVAEYARAKGILAAGGTILPADDDGSSRLKIGACYEAANRIAGNALATPAQTLEGFRAKLRVIEAGWYEVPDECEDLFSLFNELLRNAEIGTAMAMTMGLQTATASNPDAELIATCARLVHIRTRELAAQEAEDDPNITDAESAVIETQLDVMNIEWLSLAKRVQEIDRPKTLEGVAAMARCVVQCSGRGCDGSITMIDLAEWMAIRVSEFLAGREVE